MMPFNSIRSQIRRDLPAEAFRNRPAQLLSVLPVVSIIVLGSLTIVRYPLPWYAATGVSCLVGSGYASLLFFGHELAHGAVIRSRRWQNILLYPCFFVFCLPPSLWRCWHHVAHHGNTNTAERDPDHFGTLDDYRRSAANRFWYRFAPGSGHWLSSLYLFFFFSLQVQGVLWVRSRTGPFRGLHRLRVSLESALMALCWALLAFRLGWYGGWFVVVLPMLTANFIVLSYIVTNHMTMQLSEKSDVLATTMSVTTLPMLDRIHFYFSHHVEHHLFPAMSSRYYPLVRVWLRTHAGDRYLSPPHWKALVVVFASPRLYDGPLTLADPYNGRRCALGELAVRLRAGAPRGECDSS
jgi:fatty acid desaturase